MTDVELDQDDLLLNRNNDPNEYRYEPVAFITKLVHTGLDLERK